VVTENPVVRLSDWALAGLSGFTVRQLVEVPDAHRGSDDELFKTNNESQDP
jgi:hypothetical protein